MTGRLRWRGLRTEVVDSYAGVLIPLDQAHLHSHSARCGRAEYEGLPEDDEEERDGFLKDRAGDDDDDEERGMLEMTAAEYSIEGLRREVRKGEHGARSDYESQFCNPNVPLALGEPSDEGFMSGKYTRDTYADFRPPEKSMLINKAVQDIGMGRYNWQLFVLCGFGWFADK